LEQSLISLIEQGKRNFAINLASVDYLYSDSINKFINLNHKVLNVYGRLALLAPNASLTQILQRAGIQNFLKIYKNEEELKKSSEDIIQQTSTFSVKDIQSFKPAEQKPVSEYEDFRAEIGRAIKAEPPEEKIVEDFAAPPEAVYTPPPQPRMRPQPPQVEDEPLIFEPPQPAVQPTAKFTPEFREPPPQPFRGFTEPPLPPPPRPLFDQFPKAPFPSFDEDLPPLPVKEPPRYAPMPEVSIQPPPPPSRYSPIPEASVQPPPPSRYAPIPEVSVQPPPPPSAQKEIRPLKRPQERDRFIEEEYEVKKKKFPKAAVLIPLLLIIIGGGGYYLYNSYLKQVITPPPSTEIQKPVVTEPPQVQVEEKTEEIVKEETPVVTKEPAVPEKTVIEKPKPGKKVAVTPIKKRPAPTPVKPVQTIVQPKPAEPEAKPEVKEPTPAAVETEPAPKPVVNNKLTISSYPLDATVSLNGKEAGQTPYTFDNPGMGYLEISVEKDGYIAKKMGVQYSGGEVKKHFVLAKAPTPPKPAPTPSVTRPSEPNQITAVKPAPTPETQKPEPETSEDAFEPTPTAPVSSGDTGPATIFISSLPPMADVYMDGKLIGKTNIAELKIAAGTHTMKFVKADKMLEKQMTFTAGKNPSQLIRLK